MRAKDKQMRYSVWYLLPVVLAASVLAPQARAQDTVPRFATVEPANGKVGDLLMVTGENIGKDLIAEVYLTDGKNDIKVAVTEQSATQIKFKIPTAKIGRYRLMVLTKGKEPKLIEQPVRVEVEE
jgi:hypothetical protein